MNTQTESSYRSTVLIPTAFLPAVSCQIPKVMRAVVYDVEDPKADPQVREVSMPQRGPGQPFHDA